MAKDESIKSVLVIGSGPIVIGQACEFDYSGTQACRVLREEGVSEDCAAFVAEILYLGGLVVIDTDDQILPTAAFDSWLSREPEERWHNLVTLWIQTSRP